MGRWHKQVLGLPFTRERGDWKLAEFYPLGVVPDQPRDPELEDRV